MSISWDDVAKKKKREREGWRLQTIRAAYTWDYMSRPELVSWRLCVQTGGGRTINASISLLYYVPACVSSLMQSLCPPNVTHTHAAGTNARTRSRTHTVSVFLVSTKGVIAAAFQVEHICFASSKLIYLISLFSSFLSGQSRSSPQLIHNGFPGRRGRSASIGN